MSAVFWLRINQKGPEKSCLFGVFSSPSPEKSLGCDSHVDRTSGWFNSVSLVLLPARKLGGTGRNGRGSWGEREHSEPHLGGRESRQHCTLSRNPCSRTPRGTGASGHISQGGLGRDWGRRRPLLHRAGAWGSRRSYLQSTFSPDNPSQPVNSNSSRSLAGVAPSG